MKELSDKLHNQIKKFQDGELEIEDLETLVDDARELYERLLIIKFKAYEKYGKPESDEITEVKKQVEESVSTAPIEEAEEVVSEVKEELDTTTEKEESAAESEETAFDLSGITEEQDNSFAQPSFDFTAVEDDSQESAQLEEDHFKEDEEIKSAKPKEEVSEKIKDSHVERKESEDDDSLNRKLKVEDDQLSLRKKLQSTPIKDLKDEISIAKKFEYITFMFEGKNEKYEEAIKILNNCESGEEAKNKLNEYSTKYDWDLENKSIIKFVELVERRYL